MRIDFTEFGGMSPRTDAHILAPGWAAFAENTHPGKPHLTGWHTPLATVDSVQPTAQSLYLYDHDNSHYWFEFDTVVDVVRPPILNDPFGYVTWCDDSYPKVTRNDIALSSAPYPAAFRRLGIPQPAKPTVNAAVMDADAKDVDKIDVAYVITYVDDWGREGPASVASGIVTRQESSDTISSVTVYLPSAPTGDNHNFGVSSKYRIYRSNTTSAGTSNYQFLAELATSATEYVDTTYSYDLLETLETAEWFGPADDDTSLYPHGPLRGLCVVANSFLAGFSGTMVMFSEVGVPHAWPVSYRMAMEYDVVALAAVGSSVAVLTTGYPALLSGSHPSNMSQTKLTDRQPCIAKQSVVAAEDGVFYASPDGICLLSGSRAQVVTSEIWTKDEWDAINPATLRGYWYEGSYFGFSDNTAFVLVPHAGNRQYRLLDLTMSAVYSDLETDTLYYHTGGVISAFNQGAGYLNYTWRSDIRRIQDATNFALGQVRATRYPVDFTLFATNNDGSVSKTFNKTVTSDAPFFLPAGFRAQEWQVEISGSGAVAAVYLAHNHTELEL